MSSRRCEKHGHIYSLCDRPGYLRCRWCGDYARGASLSQMENDAEYPPDPPPAA